MLGNNMRHSSRDSERGELILAILIVVLILAAILIYLVAWALYALGVVSGLIALYLFVEGLSKDNITEVLLHIIGGALLIILGLWFWTQGNAIMQSPIGQAATAILNNTGDLISVVPKLVKSNG